MADIDDVLERLVTDPEFAALLASDPAAALAGYDLGEDDLAMLSSPAGDAGGLGAVEQRTSKAGLIGMLAGVVEPAPKLAANQLTGGDPQGSPPRAPSRSSGRACHPLSPMAGRTSAYSA